MRPLQEIVKETELVHEIECRRMDRVSAKVPQEVSVLLDDDDADAHACQEEAQHYPGRSATGDATTRFEHGHDPDDDRCRNRPSCLLSAACLRALNPAV